MLRLVWKRLLQLIPTMLIVVSITFVLTRIIPGDPASVLAGPEADPQLIAELQAKLGLDKSIPEQFLMYVKDVCKGDFGTSLNYNEPVFSLIMDRIPKTLMITFTGLIIALIGGVILGTVSALRQNSIIDHFCTFFALLGASLPVFWIAIMSIYVFSVQLGWLPVMGMGSMENGIGDVVSHMLLPCLCLALAPMATFTRTTRSSMLDTINNDYIRALRARGLKERQVIWKHAFKNALPPIVSVLGVQLGVAFSGAIMTKNIFSWPGMGTMISTAINTRDYSLVQGAILTLAVVNVTISLLMDIVYMLIQPKVKI